LSKNSYMHGFTIKSGNVHVLINLTHSEILPKNEITICSYKLKISSSLTSSQGLGSEIN